MRRWSQWIWVHFLYFTGILWWAQHRLAKSGAIVVLTFHRVLDDKTRTNSQEGMIIRAKTFERLCQYLKRRFEVVSIESASPGQPCDRLRIACTFDDGWEDNYRVALPIIRRHALPVSVFLCPGIMDKVNPFWPERAVAALRAWGEASIDNCIETLKRFAPEQRERTIAALEQGKYSTLMSTDRTMSWQQAAEMAKVGVRFGSHTSMHEILTQLPVEMAKVELSDSKAQIEARLDCNCSVLAYPNGNYNAEICGLAASIGYRLALTQERQAWTTSTNPLTIPRFNTYEENIVNPLGHFSPAMFMYTTVWIGWWKLRKASMRERLSGAERTGFSGVTGGS